MRRRSWELWFASSAFPGNIRNPPHPRSAKRERRQSGRSRVVGGSFNKLGNLASRLVLGTPRRGGLQTRPPELLTVHAEAVMGSVRPMASRTPHSPLRAASSKQLLVRGEWVERAFRGQGSGQEPPIARVQSPGPPGAACARRPPPVSWARTGRNSRPAGPSWPREAK